MAIKKQNPFLAPRRKFGETLRSQKFGTTGKRFGTPTSLGVFREPEAEVEQPKMLDLSQPRKSTSNVITRYDRSGDFVEGRKYKNQAGDEFVWTNGAFMPWAEWEAANTPAPTAVNIAAPAAPAAPTTPASTEEKGDSGGFSSAQRGSIAADLSQPAAESTTKAGWDLSTAAPEFTGLLGNIGKRAALGAFAGGLTHGSKGVMPGIASGITSMATPLGLGMLVNEYGPKVYAGIENKVAHSDIKDTIAANPDVSFDDVMSRVDQAEEDYAMHSRPLAGQALEAIGLDIPNNTFTDMLGISTTPDLDAWNAERVEGYDQYAEDMGLSPSQQAMAMNQATLTNRQGEVVGYGSYLGDALEAQTLADAYSTTPTSQLHAAMTNPETAYKDNVNATNQAQQDAAALAATHSGFAGIDSTYSNSFSRAMNQMGYSPARAEDFALSAVNNEVARQTQERHAAAMAAAGNSAGGTGSTGNAISGGVDRSSTAGNASTNAGAGTGPGGASENHRANQWQDILAAASAAYKNSLIGRGTGKVGGVFGGGVIGNMVNSSHYGNGGMGSSSGASVNQNARDNLGDSPGNMGGGSHSSPAGSDRGTIICTELYRQGLLPRNIWAADMRYAQQNISETTLCGYHFWAESCVRVMRRSKFWTSFWKVVMGGWAHHAAWKMGKHPKPNWMGRLVGVTIVPFSHVVGRVLRVADLLRNGKKDRGTHGVA